MEAPWEEWEAAAEEIVESTCTSTPVDAFKLAKACGFEVRGYSGSRAERRGDVIYVNTRMRPTRQHGSIAHELGHFALEEHDVPDSEDGARWAGGALILPRRVFSPQLTKTAWSLPKLRELHVNASAELIAIRIVQVRDAVATVLDGHRTTKRVWSPWIDDARGLRRVSRFERELAERALEAGEEVREDELCYAVPIIDGRWQRVIVVCELEQLSLRL